MKIWLITVGEPLPIDSGRPRLLRTGVLANILTQRGHQVTWWTSTFDHSRKSHRSSVDAVADINTVQIQMLHGCGYASNISLRRLVDHAMIARRFRSAARAVPRPDIILCSYPTIELSREAVHYGLRHRLPVLLDIRDLWPDVLLDVLPARWRWVGRTALCWLTAQARYALGRCTGLIGISERYLAWGLTYAQRSRHVHDGIYPLGYAVPELDIAAVTLAQENLAAVGVDATQVIVWYVGTLGHTYDLVPVIRAARVLQERQQTGVQFVVSGSGGAEQLLRAEAAGLTNVIFTGWIGTPEIVWLRQHAAIGLQPYAAGAPQGLANKLFEYLSAGLPVISSLRGENEALLREHACGMTYAAGDAADFLVKLESLIAHPPLQKAMGCRAQRLFDERYSVDQVYGGLAAHVEGVAAQCTQRST
jgi:glycosyltransferase involved in cell wall biosynthesis